MDATDYNNKFTNLPASVLTGAGYNIFTNEKDQKSHSTCYPSNYLLPGLQFAGPVARRTVPVETLDVRPLEGWNDQIRKVDRGGRCLRLLRTKFADITGKLWDSWSGEVAHVDIESLKGALSNTHTNSTLAPAECIDKANCTLVIDWLTVRYTSSALDVLSFIPNNIHRHGDYEVEVVQGGGGRQYNCSGSVRWKGQPIARFVFDSKLKMYQNTLLLTFNNNVFYSADIQALGIPYLISEIGTILHSSGPKISRLDIAVDGLAPLELINSYMSGQHEKNGRSKVNNSSSKCGGVAAWSRQYGCFTGMTIGDRKSGRFLRIYNKTKELLTHGTKKDYISSYLNTNRVAVCPVTGDVYRTEIQLGAEFFRRYLRDFDINDLSDYSRLSSVYLFACSQGDFAVFSSSGDTNKSRRKKISLTDGLNIVAATFQRGLAVVVDRVRAIKISVKRLIKEAALSDDDDVISDLLIAASTLLKQHGLASWFHKRFSFIIDDIASYAFASGVSMERIDDFPNWNKILT